MGVLDASTSPPKERYAVPQDNVIKLIQPGFFDDQLTEILRSGARALLAKAVEAEVADFLDKHADLKTGDGQQRVVRHGHLPERKVMTGIGLQCVMQRLRFSREFKIEAVELVRERGVSAAQAGRDLGVHENVLRKWVREFGSDPVQAFPGHGQMKPEQLEIERLRREVNKLKAERDILKKAAAFFAREAT
jgi:transposase